VNEFLYRRADIADIAGAQLCALAKAGPLGFGRYLVSATSPLNQDDLLQLRTDAPAAVRRRVPRYEDVYRARKWKMFPAIDRVYVNERARRDLGWQPRFDFGGIIEMLADGGDPRSPLARTGSKGYHEVEFENGPYPVES